MPLHLVRGVEPLVTRNHVVVRCKSRFEAAKEDVVLVELVLEDGLLVRVAVRAHCALELLRGRISTPIRCHHLLRLLQSTIHLIVLLLILLLLHHICGNFVSLDKLLVWESFDY